jgi:hypothetical protein
MTTAAYSEPWLDRGRIGQHQLVQLADAIDHLPALEIDRQFALLQVEARDDTQVAVVDFLVVVVLDLHDLVAEAEGPTEPFDTDLARRVQRFLQLDIERASAKTAAVHWAQHLDVADWIKTEPLRDAFLHDREQLAYPIFRLGSVDEVEVAAFGRGEIGH